MAVPASAHVIRLFMVHAIWAGKRKAISDDVGWKSELKVDFASVTLFLASSPCDNRLPSRLVTRKPIDISPTF